MLKPNPSRTLPSVPQSGAVPNTTPADAPFWNPLTPIEHLPTALAQLRENQRHINRLVQDAENQVVHFLRYGPLDAHLPEIKQSIERFYPFSEDALRANHNRLNAGITNENIHVVLTGDYSFWKGFTPDWNYISEYRPIPLAVLEKQSHKWIWAKVAANPLIDWNAKSINRHFRQLKDHFEALSANTGINWTPELLRAFASAWDYSTDGLLGNESLPWEDDTFPTLLSEIAPEDAELDEDELTEIAAEMRFSTWQRRSLNRYYPWTTDLLRQHTDELDWGRLSANPALPFSFALLDEFAEYWDWSELAANPSFFEKILAPLLSDTIVHEFLLLTT